MCFLQAAHSTVIRHPAACPDCTPDCTDLHLAVIMLGGGKARTEQLCLESWFVNWDYHKVYSSSVVVIVILYTCIVLLLQREKFLSTLVQETSGPSEEDLLFGMVSMGLAESR